jgi:hypothetical protein
LKFNPAGDAAANDLRWFKRFDLERRCGQRAVVFVPKSGHFNGQRTQVKGLADDESRLNSGVNAAAAHVNQSMLGKQNVVHARFMQCLVTVPRFAQKDDDRTKLPAIFGIRLDQREGSVVVRVTPFEAGKG